MNKQETVAPKPAQIGMTEQDTEQNTRIGQTEPILNQQVPVAPPLHQQQIKQQPIVLPPKPSEIVT